MVFGAYDRCSSVTPGIHKTKEAKEAAFLLTLTDCKLEGKTHVKERSKLIAGIHTFL